MKKYYLPYVLALFLLVITGAITSAQVKTNFNNPVQLNAAGRFAQKYQEAAVTLPALDHQQLLQKENAALRLSKDAKPFQIAQAIPVDIDVLNKATWTHDEKFSYGKLTIRATGAKSASINFDKFFLPKGTELFVYNEGGNMITGPVTEAENNSNGVWGSWVYKGEWITVEVKTPVTTFKQLLLHINNVSYGYKEIYQTKVGNFGQSGACNINVICLGSDWEPERNSVALLLNGAGTAICSGSMLRNVCPTATPYFLTADHCFDNSPGNWRFTFQAWSPTCTPSTNSDGVTYNGSTLRARWAPTDFCLVELNQAPPENSNIHYAGWNRTAVPATSATGIHHPLGDVMKYARANGPVSRADHNQYTGLHWRANWNAGVTQSGSSGSPLFDQNHQVVGQLAGGPSNCGSAEQWDFYGSFDMSWTGGGTSVTRLSDWLDPANTGVTETHTRNRSVLSATLPAPAPITYIEGIDHSATCRTPKWTYYARGAADATNFKWYVRRLLPTPGNLTLVKDGPSNFYTRGYGGAAGTCEEFEIKVVATICNGPATEAWGEGGICRCINPLAASSAPAGLQVTPNPASSTVQIQLTGGEENAKATSTPAASIQMIRIVSKVGEVKKVINGNRSNTFTLAISDLPADIYTVLVFDGKKWYTSKLVKK